MNSSFTRLAAMVLSLLLCGCANEAGVPRTSGRAVSARVDAQTTLPGYAQPRGRILDPSEYGTDVINYRALSQKDFRGIEPPPDMLPYRDRLGAATCAYIVTTPQTEVLVQPIRTPDGRILYQAVPQNLGFRAQMDRSCSWWNSEQHSLKTDYVLEHEQIHFALFELEARRLNSEVDRLRRMLESTDTTLHGARQKVRTRLEGVLGESLQRVLAQSHAFDEDTSMGYRPERQKEWLRRVESELSRTQLAF
jgi:hypothetical protein